MSTFAGTPSPITLSDVQTPSSIVIIGPSNWLLTLTPHIELALDKLALRVFQWDPALAGRKSSLPQKNRIRVRKLSKLLKPRALALMV